VRLALRSAQDALDHLNLQHNFINLVVTEVVDTDRVTAHCNFAAG
jgi:hypothetical protein